MNEERDLTDPQVLRMNAEKKLRLTQKENSISGIETDVKRLVHELQVHQIELEMQNEELRKANERTEAALKKYTMMYDFAPMGYFSLDHTGLICELNFTGAEMLGERRFSLLHSNFRLYVSEETLPTFNNFLSMVYMGKSKQSCELMVGSDNEHLHDVYVEAIVTGDESQCLLSVVDISAYKKQNNF